MIAPSANQRFIVFQTRAIFIFEQSQVGRARSVSGSGSSSLCAIRATVIGTRSTPDWFGLLRLSPFPSLSHTFFLSRSLVSPLFSLGVSLSLRGSSPDDAALSGIPAETDVARGHVSRSLVYAYTPQSPPTPPPPLSFVTLRVRYESRSRAIFWIIDAHYTSPLFNDSTHNHEH